MAKREDGGPAFPTLDPQDSWEGPNAGMSLRDWFAGQALAGLLETKPAHATEENVATLAYGIADAMLAARSR